MEGGPKRHCQSDAMAIIYPSVALLHILLRVCPSCILGPKQKQPYIALNNTYGPQYFKQISIVKDNGNHYSKHAALYYFELYLNIELCTTAVINLYSNVLVSQWHIIHSLVVFSSFHYNSVFLAIFVLWSSRNCQGAVC